VERTINKAQNNNVDLSDRGTLGGCGKKSERRGRKSRKCLGQAYARISSAQTWFLDFELIINAMRYVTSAFVVDLR